MFEVVKPLVGVTGLDAADDAEGPVTFVATTVKV